MKDYDSLPDYNKITFPKMPGIPFEELCPDAPPKAIQLLQKFLVYNSQYRLPAKEVCRYFRLFHDYKKDSSRKL